MSNNNNGTAITTSPNTTPQTTLPATSKTDNPDPKTTGNAVTTSIATAASPPPSTQVFTSIVTAPAGNGGATGTSPNGQQTVTLTTPHMTAENPTGTGSSESSASSSAAAALQNGNKGADHAGLTAGGKTAIAVVIPLVVIALLFIAALFLWRRRRARKNEEELRKNEMEEYGYNPNHDPTLPAVAATDEIHEDTSGYRGWGTTPAGSMGRKTSITVSGSGMKQYSDGGYQSPGSPREGVSDGYSGDQLMSQHHGYADGGETIAALGAAPAARQYRPTDIRRGPSNASSSYSNGDHSNGEADGHMPMNDYQDYHAYNDNSYYQQGPYEQQYGVALSGPPPVIQDNPARRNTRIQQAPYPRIAQNF